MEEKISSCGLGAGGFCGAVALGCCGGRRVGGCTTLRLLLPRAGELEADDDFPPLNVRCTGESFLTGGMANSLDLGLPTALAAAAKVDEDAVGRLDLGDFLAFVVLLAANTLCLGLLAKVIPRGCTTGLEEAISNPLSSSS